MPFQPDFPPPVHPLSEIEAFCDSQPLYMWAKDRRCLVPMGTVLERLLAGEEPKEAMTRTPPRKKRHSPYSQYRGVTWDKSKPYRWSVRLVARGKTLYIGSFETEQEAARAYDRAARAYGKRLNFVPGSVPA